MCPWHCRERFHGSQTCPWTSQKHSMDTTHLKLTTASMEPEATKQLNDGFESFQRSSQVAIAGFEGDRLIVAAGLKQ